MTFDLNAKTCVIFVCHLASIQMKIEACFCRMNKEKLEADIKSLFM